MRFHTVIVVALVVVLPVALLSACAPSEPELAAEEAGAGETYASEVLDTAYEGALSVSNQLMLGTMMLEETEHAVTPAQAAALLPLWQALQAGGVTVEAEVNAVIKQIEGEMTEAQLDAIAVMQLTREDMQAWMEEQGVSPPGGGDADARATRQAQGGGGEGGPPSGGEMSPEMATRRAEFENMSDEEREAARATMQAGGGFPGRSGGPGGPGGGGRRTFGFLLEPLVDLLEERAGEG